MKYINNLTDEIIIALERIEKEDNRYKSRYRAKAILLSNEGKKVNEIADILNCNIRTIYRWYDRFEREEINGLYELKGRGRKPKLTIENDEKRVKEYIKKAQYK